MERKGRTCGTIILFQSRILKKSLLPHLCRPIAGGLYILSNCFRTFAALKKSPNFINQE